MTRFDSLARGAYAFLVLLGAAIATYKRPMKKGVQAESNGHWFYGGHFALLARSAGELLEVAGARPGARGDVGHLRGALPR